MSISMKLRAAAAGAISLALLASGAANAFAAPSNPQPNGSKGSFYLWSGETADLQDGNTSRVYTRSESMLASASNTDINAEVNPSATRPVTGAASFNGVFRFISDKNAAAVNGGTATWKAWSVDSAAGVNGGTTLADMTLDAFGPQTNSVVAAGGSYWYGIAYTINNGVTAVGAVYREINITAGSGNYTVGPIVEDKVITDVATTTTASALATTVEAGQTTVLTANVTASKTVTGNVEFFNGTTSLGTVGLASGAATKTVTVPSVGVNTFSARFVETTVDTSATTADRFLASSADVTVIGEPPVAPPVPNAPSENSLNVNTANGATAGYDVAHHTASLNDIPASANGKSVNAFVYSTPIYLGTVTISGTTATFDVSVLPAGDHKLVIVDPITGDVLAWATFTKSDASSQPTFSKTINADVANGSGNPADGEFSLTNLSGSTVNLTNPALVNGKSIVSGQLGDFKVTDMRVVTKAGWVLKTDVAQFVKGTDTIANTALGIAPTVVSQTAGTAPVLGAAQVSGSAVYPWNFATVAAGSYSGVSTYNANLVFTAPVGSAAGTYTSTLTLTLISN